MSIWQGCSEKATHNEQIVASFLDKNSQVFHITKVALYF